MNNTTICHICDCEGATVEGIGTEGETILVCEDCFAYSQGDDCEEDEGECKEGE